MTIRVSAAREVERLTAALRGGTAGERDAAVARLRVIGVRAVARLTDLLRSDAEPAARTAALRTLEGLDDQRAAELALQALADPDASVAGAAIAVLRGWVARETGTRVIEALSAAALDAGRDPAVRLAALDALSDLPRQIVQPLLAALPPAWAPGAPHADGELGDPVSAREWLAGHQSAPLSELHEFVRRARDQEHLSSARGREDWRIVRGAAHAALASRGSRVALYDLREAFDAADGPLPLDFLTAMAMLGDATCLEPLARAWSAAPPGWWRARISDAATDIVRRHRLTGRLAVVRRMRAKWPGFV